MVFVSTLGVDGDDLPASSSHHQHPVQAFCQHLQKLHVCANWVKEYTAKQPQHAYN